MMQLLFNTKINLIKLDQFFWMKNMLNSFKTKNQIMNLLLSILFIQNIKSETNFFTQSSLNFYPNIIKSVFKYFHSHDLI